MNCEKCTQAMNLQYDLVERETHFSLYECEECGHKFLHRRPSSSQKDLATANS